MLRDRRRVGPNVRFQDRSIGRCTAGLGRQLPNRFRNLIVCFLASVADSGRSESDLAPAFRRPEPRFRKLNDGMTVGVSPCCTDPVAGVVGRERRGPVSLRRAVHRGSWPGLHGPKPSAGGKSGHAVLNGSPCPHPFSRNVRRALQGQCRPPSPHPATAASDNELVRI